MSAALFPRGVPLAKRLFDLLVALLGLILLSPLLALLALAVRLNMGAPVIFAQKRPGYRGKIFTLYKFRSMRDEVDSRGRPLSDEERLTALGKFMRSTSLDEFPELINVLRGEMSLVGPRPLLVEYLPRYSAEQMRRHDVFPGMTGWAQVNGRNILSWEDRFRLDVWYVDHWSFWLDVKILVMTALKVVRREGISQPGKATMTEFMGSEGKDSNSES